MREPKIKSNLELKFKLLKILFKKFNKNFTPEYVCLEKNLGVKRCVLK